MSLPRAWRDPCAQPAFVASTRTCSAAGEAGCLADLGACLRQIPRSVRQSPSLPGGRARGPAVEGLRPVLPSLPRVWPLANPGASIAIALLTGVDPRDHHRRRPVRLPWPAGVTFSDSARSPPCVLSSCFACQMLAPVDSWRGSRVRFVAPARQRLPGLRRAMAALICNDYS